MTYLAEGRGAVDRKHHNAKRLDVMPNRQQYKSISSNSFKTNDIFYQSTTIVGIITAAMGYFYGKMLDTSVNFIWKHLPTFVSEGEQAGKIGNALFGGARYILTACSMGGLLMGIISSKLQSSSYTVAESEFVLTMSFHSDRTDTNEKYILCDNLPKILPALPALLLLSLITSTFGFLVGPEAPHYSEKNLLNIY